MVNNLPAIQETQVQSLGRKIPWRRKWQLTSVFLPGESLGQRDLAGYSPGGCKELDATEATQHNEKEKMMMLFFTTVFLCISQAS